MENPDAGSAHGLDYHAQVAPAYPEHPILAFLDRRPMDGGMLVDAVFRLFAARAAAELERKAMAGALAQRFG